MRSCRHGCGRYARKNASECRRCIRFRRRYGSPFADTWVRMCDYRDWTKVAKSWRYNDPEFRKMHDWGVSVARLVGNQIVTSECHRERKQRSSVVIIKTVGNKVWQERLVSRLVASTCWVMLDENYPRWGVVKSIPSCDYSLARWTLEKAGHHRHLGVNTMGTFCTQLAQVVSTFRVALNPLLTMAIGKGKKRMTIRKARQSNELAKENWEKYGYIQDS